MSEVAQGPPSGASGEEPDAEGRGRFYWVFYGLGVSLQTALWFLLFLAIIIAVSVGHTLTEFRYVGF
ncbi:MAG: hypothetical protein WC709_09335 [Thermoleophilia bacterium]